MVSSKLPIQAAFGPPDSESTNGRQTNLTYRAKGTELVLLNDKLVQLAVLLKADARLETAK